MTFTAAWAVASTLALGFQCDLPSPWQLGAARCINLQALNTGIDIANILLEVCLIALPAALMPQIRTSWTKRLIVIGCFTARAAVIATLIGHVTTSHNLARYADATWAYIAPTIWAQATMNVSVITACVPGMQQVLAELRTGMTVLTVSTAHQEPDASKSAGSLFGSSSSDRNHDRDRPRVMRSKHNSVFGSRTERARAEGRATSDGKLWELSRMETSMKARGSGRAEDEESESVKGLTDHDIVVTREVSCSVGDGSRPSHWVGTGYRVPPEWPVYASKVCSRADRREVVYPSDGSSSGRAGRI
ncbi:hypothetical protein LTR36_002032 [Oleoguttula mirabilis]|uniref:Rhodopsin domain-containing protein n=1 Tax=Oleoguttula mirabilis TaxID=1507867 RepID=A0AAV9JN29_9PEZI|nr:hypothetical protein LTR36_002032 [Oleoguttula mirabilis]